MLEVKRKIKKEQKCFKENRVMESEAIQRRDFKAAAFYSENATRSLLAIARLQEYAAELEEIKALTIQIGIDHDIFMRSRI